MSQTLLLPFTEILFIVEDEFFTSDAFKYDIGTTSDLYTNSWTLMIMHLKRRVVIEGIISVRALCQLVRESEGY